MNTLSISLFNRPKYTKILFEHLNKCINIQAYTIFIFCEPNHSEVIDLAVKFRPQQTYLVINSKKYGCNKNIYQCLSMGFRYNDFHIHLEDDTIPSKDFLVYCEWCRHRFGADSSVFSITGYNQTSQHDLNKSNELMMQNWFTPWGWATWKDRWESIVKPSFVESTNSSVSWDMILSKYKNDLLEIRPIVARIQNIGAELGTHVRSASWHRQHHYNPYWIETNQSYNTEFKII